MLRYSLVLLLEQIELEDALLLQERAVFLVRLLRLDVAASGSIGLVHVVVQLLFPLLLFELLLDKRLQLKLHILLILGGFLEFREEVGVEHLDRLQFPLEHSQLVLQPLSVHPSLL